MKKSKKILSVAIFFTFLSFLCNNGYYYVQTVTASNLSTKKQVTVGGVPFGIKLFTDGVMIIKMQDININGNCSCPAKEAGLQLNDVIISVNKENVKSNEQVLDLIENCNGECLNLTVKRNNKRMELTLNPIKTENNVYKAGMWIRDSSAGIGTITYYDGETNTFGALGHGICDADTGTLMPLGKGEICTAQITEIKSGEKGSPGGLNGYFENTVLGNVTQNCETGIYGTISNSGVFTNEILPVADKTEIKKGKAQIISTIDENGAKKYDIEICSINLTHDVNKRLVIKITDEQLLKKTGGIIQGMSGSPIIQNNQLVGAVTHVFVNEPDKGYGIIAEEMIANYK